MSITRQVRQTLAREIARFFLAHLRAELAKPDDLTRMITWEGVSFGALTADMIQELVTLFPGLDREGEPPYNLFRRWWHARRPPVPYPRTTFKLYNRTFLQRVIDLREGTRASRQTLRDNTFETLRQARTRGRTVSFDMISTGEAIMYELLRNIVQTSDILPEEACRQILFRQHTIINGAMYDFFNSELRETTARTENLLATILPGAVVEELKLTGRIEPRLVQSASVLFADVVGFTRQAAVLSPRDLLAELDTCFSHFDHIMGQHKMEKIKTIGDAYMCAGGVIETNRTHAVDAVLTALRIQEFMRKYRKSRQRKGQKSWKLRIGIHTGPLITGIVGQNRYSFDIWGDTVNVASRMEEASHPGRINITAETERLVRDFFQIRHRGRYHVKGKGETDMYFIMGLRPELSLKGHGKVPTKRFRQLYLRLRNGE